MLVITVHQPCRHRNISTHEIYPSHTNGVHTRSRAWRKYVNSQNRVYNYNVNINYFWHIKCDNLGEWPIFIYGCGYKQYMIYNVNALDLPIFASAFSSIINK